MCDRNILDRRSLQPVSSVCSAAESGCLLSAVVFHHVHSLLWHDCLYSVRLCVYACVHLRMTHQNFNAILWQDAATFSQRSVRSQLRSSINIEIYGGKKLHIVCVCLTAR